MLPTIENSAMDAEKPAAENVGERNSAKFISGVVARSSMMTNVAKATPATPRPIIASGEVHPLAPPSMMPTPMKITERVAQVIEDAVSTVDETASRTMA
ncbi:hypothetical protein ACT89R_29775 (plasmid) [Rhodococcus qingshengii]